MECGNRLRVGVRAKNASVSGLALSLSLSLSPENCSVSSKRCFRKRRRQQPECVRNASKMRQKCVKMGLVLLKKEMRQKCVKIASKMRQKCAEHLWGRTPFGRYRIVRNYSSYLPGDFAVKDGRQFGG